MLTVRHALLRGSFVLLPLTLAFAPRADQLAFGPKDDTSLTRKFSVEMALYVDDLRVVADGQEVPVPLEELGSGFTIELLMEVADRIVSSREGRATELVRTYEKLSLRGGPEGQAESMDDEVDKILDKPVRFRWNEEESDYDVSYADADARGDAKLLEGLHADMDFTMLLPDREVSKGDTWTATGVELAWIFLPGGLPGGPEEGDEIWHLIEDTLEAQFEQAFRSFEVVCTYQGTRAEGDVQVGEIAFRFDDKATIDLTDVIQAAVAAQGGEMDIQVDIQATLGLEFDGSGTLLWHLAGQHAHAMTMNVEQVFTVQAEADVDAMGQQFSGEFSLEVSGNGKWRMSAK